MEYYETSDNEYWLSEIEKGEWGAAKYLHYLLSSGEFRKLCGENARVFMRTEGRALLSFCTLAKRDDIPDTDLEPWVGFVYTFPQYRGNHYAGELLKHCEKAAKAEGAEYIHISTGETGLYEKYGYTFRKLMKDNNGEDSRIYRIKL